MSTTLEDPSVRFARCKKTGVYDTVNSGERCTIDMAKKLGIFDPVLTTHKDFPGIRTFNKEVDREQERTSQALCQTDADQTEAYPFCALEYGAGFRRKPGYPGTCIVGGCPTGFEPQGLTSCKKPTEEAVVSKAAKCQERPYDWYTIPNYHLGNTHTSVGNKCYGPCTPGEIPLLGTDPVDGAKIAFDAVDHPEQCTSKEDFFGGKYADTSDYCPLAWIKRLSATPERVQQEWVTALHAVPGTANEHRDAVEKNLGPDAASVAAQAQNGIENVRPMATAEGQRACAALATPERIKEAWDICNTVLKEPKTAQTWWKGDTPVVAAGKEAALRGACHTVFCDEKNNLAATVDREPLCFEDVRELTEQELAAKNAQAKPATFEVPSALAAMARVKKIFAVMFILTIVSAAIVVVVALWLEFFWPFLVLPLWRKIQRLFYSFTPSDKEDQLAYKLARLVRGQKSA